MYSLLNGQQQVIYWTFIYLFFFLIFKFRSIISCMKAKKNK